MTKKKEGKACTKEDIMNKLEEIHKGLSEDYMRGFERGVKFMLDHYDKDGVE